MSDPRGLRTAYCGELRAADTGREVAVCGWVDRRRTHGEHLAFLDVRDHTGVVQCVVDERIDARSEYVVRISGVVRERPEGTANPALATGEVEVGDCTVEILTRSEPLPVPLHGDTDENLRLRYRYLDLRRERMQHNLRTRARVNTAIREAMDAQGFVEIETPMLVASTPEGARDFVVPSRLHPGDFYALPQSPQLFKQLCMVGGLDRYYQIARCLRDEDLRADRQFEFMQLDAEVAFVGADEVIDFITTAVSHTVEAVTGAPLGEVPIITWDEAMERYGSDKPDIRFGMELIECTDLFAETQARVFKVPCVKGICVPGGAGMGRNRIDELTAKCKRWGAKGLAWFRLGEPGTDGVPELDGALTKFMSTGERAALPERLGAATGDMIMLIADERRPANRVLGLLRLELGRPPVNEGGLAPLWVVEFPLFEDIDEAGNPRPAHHPFTMPHPDDLDYLVRGGGKSLLQRAFAGLRPGDQRLGVGLGECADPRRRHPEAGVRHSRDRRRRGRTPLRLPAGGIRLRGASPRRLRLRYRSAGGAAGRGGEHPRGHRLPEDPVGFGPAHRRPRSGRSCPPRRTGPAPAPELRPGHWVSIRRTAADEVASAEVSGSAGRKYSADS